MLHDAFLSPASIAVIGGSGHTDKPGGRLLLNLLDGRFQGSLVAVNPRWQPAPATNLTVCSTIREINTSPDLGILAIPAPLCPDAIRALHETAGTRSFLIISAGFSESGSEGKAIETEIQAYALERGIQIAGPNCTGFITPLMSAGFTTPVPPFETGGATLISASGATAVFLLEAGLQTGMKFHSVYSVGNSLMIGPEEILEYLDENYLSGQSAPVILLYLESVKNPAKLYRHSASLLAKGCLIAALKSGRTTAGQLAASSHTGALATPDDAIDSLFRKAGILRCRDRSELINVGKCLLHPPLNGQRLAIVTHAGGPGVMLADSLTEGGFTLPALPEASASVLQTELHPGSSVKNPFDILATAGKDQLSATLKAIGQSGQYDGTAVILGSPGLFDETDLFEELQEFVSRSAWPVYTVIPSPLNAAGEIARFLQKGGSYFSDESHLGQALSRIAAHRLIPTGSIKVTRESPDRESGFLPAPIAYQWLQDAGLSIAHQRLVHTGEEALDFLRQNGAAVVLKVPNLNHKSDQKAILTGLSSKQALSEAFHLLSDHFEGPLLIQHQSSGHELYFGLHYRPGFGHMAYLGKGGVNMEVWKDIQGNLLPLSIQEIHWMTRQVKSAREWDGFRNQPGIGPQTVPEIFEGLNRLVAAHPYVRELDLNPVMARPDGWEVVDVRIRI